MAKIQPLRDLENNLIAPVTHERAVYDSVGNNLETKLGRVSVKEYTSLSPEIHENQRVNTDGSIQDTTSGTSSFYKYQVVGGEEYVFSGRMGSTFTLYYLFWYDGSDEFISRENYRGYGSRYENQLVKAPANAAYARLNVHQMYADYYDLSHVQNITAQEIYNKTVFRDNVVDGLNSESVSSPLSANQGRVLKSNIDAVEEKATQYDYTIQQPTEVLEQKYVKSDSEGVLDSSYHNLYKYPVVAGETYAFNERRQATLSTYILYWANGQGEILGHEPYKGGNTAVGFYHQHVTAPEGATQAFINVSRSREDYHSFFGVQARANNEIESLSGIKTLPDVLTTAGNFGNAGFEAFRHAAIPVNPGDAYVIKNSESGTGASAVTGYAFATSDEYTPGGAIPLVAGYSVVALQKGSSVTVTIPEGCSYLLVGYSWDMPHGSGYDVQKVSGASVQRRKFRILAIGNSYSQDALAYVPYILRNMGVDIDITIGILMQSSSSVADHISNFQNETAAYTFYLNAGDGSAWMTLSGKKTIQWALENYTWDVIFSHQSSTDASSWSKYYPDVNRLLNLLYSELSYPVKFGWMLSQARPAQTNSGANYAEQTILSHYTYTAQHVERVLNEMPVDIIIPVGTAIQNARTIESLKLLGAYKDNENNTSGYGYLCPNDGVHLQEGLPCQIAAYSVILSILDALGMNEKSVYGETTRVTSEWATGKSIPSPHGTYIGSTDENCKIGQMCAIMAQKHPFSITDMNGIVNPS